MENSTMMGHLAHKDDFLTKPDVRVDTTVSNCSSHTDKPNSCTQDSDTKECVAQESNSIHRRLPAITK